MVLVTERVFALLKKNVCVGDVLHLSDAREPKCEAVLAAMTTGWCSWKNSAESLWGKGRISPPCLGKWVIWLRPSSFWVGKIRVRQCPGLGYPGAIALAEGTSGLHIWGCAHLPTCGSVLFLPACTRWHCQLGYRDCGLPVGFRGEYEQCCCWSFVTFLKFSVLGRAWYSCHVWHGQLRVLVPGHCRAAATAGVAEAHVVLVLSSWSPAWGPAFGHWLSTQQEMVFAVANNPYRWGGQIWERPSQWDLKEKSGYQRHQEFTWIKHLLIPHSGGLFPFVVSSESLAPVLPVPFSPLVVHAGLGSLTLKLNR